MGFGRSKGDAPRVVGFDFGPPAPPAAPEPMAPPMPPAPPAPAGAYPPPAAYPPPPPPPPAMPEPAYAAVPYGTPVATAPPPPQPAPAGYPAPPAFPGFGVAAPLPELKPLKQRSGISRERNVVIALLAVVLLVAGFIRFRDASDKGPQAAPEKAPKVTVSLPPTIEDLNAPPSVGGEPRLASRMGKQIMNDIRPLLPNNGRFAEMEMYGRDVPRYMLVAGDLTKGTNKALWAEMGASSEGWRVGRPHQYKNMTCATLNVGGMPGSMCTWATKVSEGVVLDFLGSNPGALAQVTVRAIREVERVH